MKKATKIWIIIASLLITLGAGIYVAGVVINGGVPMAKYQTETYTNLEDFSDIYIDTKTADITIKKSIDGNVKVVCYEQEKAPHTVTVENGTLKIVKQDNRKWYDYIGFNFKSPEITVYLPNAEYGALNVKVPTGDIYSSKDLTFDSIDVSGSTGDVECYSSAKNDIKIHLSTGDIDLNELSAKNIDLKVSTGEIEIENVTATSLTIAGGTGDVGLKNVVLSGNMSVATSTGDVDFYRIDASAIKIKVKTGDVKGSILSSKNFIANTTTGKKQVPETTEGGVCEITTSTGDIIITIAN